MGKVISLKLNKREERIVRRLNQEGITNSDLLRAALWDYFNPSGEKDSLNEEITTKDDEDKQFFYDTLYRLNTEINSLREENTKLKEEFSEEISRLNDQIYNGSSVLYSKKENNTDREQYAYDIRKNIDDLLANR